MWGTSSRDDKLRSDFGNVTEATQIGGYWVESAQAGKHMPAMSEVFASHRFRFCQRAAFARIRLGKRERTRCLIRTGVQHVQAGAIGHDIDLYGLAFFQIMFEDIRRVIQREIHDCRIILIDLVLLRTGISFSCRGPQAYLLTLAR
jgi:hypothetical protein